MFYIKQQKMTKKINNLTKQANIYKKQADKYLKESKKKNDKTYKLRADRKYCIYKKLKEQAEKLQYTLDDLELEEMNRQWEIIEKDIEELEQMFKEMEEYEKAEKEKKEIE